MLHVPTISFLFINFIITVGARRGGGGRSQASAPSLDFWEKTKIEKKRHKYL
jgi:hypothetical protein